MYTPVKIQSMMRNHFQSGEHGNKELKFYFSTKISHINYLPVCHSDINIVLKLVHSA